ncbi:MAG: hypothetical protein CBC13_06420 [Planctomycetia bacterium TMED53]|nr:MAG: hypothetical protein CBC13_06420 [Planctomycetia bacterium TMED53]
MALQGTLRELTEMALTSIRQPYPFYHGQVYTSTADVNIPGELTPVFNGAFDWHSAVHGHWTLIRALHVDSDRSELGDDHAAEIERYLAESLNAEDLSREVAYVEAHPRFEVPYGRAWLLTLCAELRMMKHPLLTRLEDLESEALGAIIRWCKKLHRPVRSGQHDQSMYSLGHFFDWATVVGDTTSTDRIREIALRHHADDQQLPLHLEPSNHDFLSPTLETADLLRRVLSPADLKTWLQQAAPALLDGSWPNEPVTCPDPTDGKLAHLDGLNLSRARALQAMAQHFKNEDMNLSRNLAQQAQTHRQAGLQGIHPEHYAGSHWLASFALEVIHLRMN